MQEQQSLSDPRRPVKQERAAGRKTLAELFEFLVTVKDGVRRKCAAWVHATIRNRLVYSCHFSACNRNVSLARRIPTQAERGCAT